MGGMNGLMKPTESGFGQMVRFGAAGAMATIADMSTFIALMHLWQASTVHAAGFQIPSYLIYQCLSFTVGLVVSYTLSVRYVFPHRAIKDRHVEFAVFFIIGVIGLLLTSGIMYTGLEILDTRALFASLFPQSVELWGFHTSSEEAAIIFMKATAIVLVFFYNFGVRKMTMFRKPD